MRPIDCKYGLRASITKIQTILFSLQLYNFAEGLGWIWLPAGETKSLQTEKVGNSDAEVERVKEMVNQSSRLTKNVIDKGLAWQRCICLPKNFFQWEVYPKSTTSQQHYCIHINLIIYTVFIVLFLQFILGLLKCWEWLTKKYIYTFNALVNHFQLRSDKKILT